MRAPICYVYVLLLSFSLNISADDHAVALLYHHVSNDTPPATSVSPATLERHLDFLEQNRFTVWPLGQILDYIEQGKPLPENTVALTFDDAYRSVYSQAFPLLQRRGWPFTLFVNSAAIDRGYQPCMNWQQLAELAAAGVEIGNHSHSHAHLVRRQGQESEQQWRNRVTTDIRRAERRLRHELKVTTRLFAYPYGEYTPALKEIIADLGFWGIAQQSGAIGSHSDPLAIPRFPMAAGHAGMQRFKISVQARPLPVRSAVATPKQSPDGDIQQLEILVDTGNYRAGQLACYSASGKPIPMRRDPAAEGQRASLDLSTIGSPGRNKVNCTAPALNEKGVYYWYSYQWLVRHPDGSWYAE